MWGFGQIWDSGNLMISLWFPYDFSWNSARDNIAPKPFFAVFEF